MQSARKATESVKESTANADASAKAGMEKTKASAQEKAERITTSDPAKKEAATLKKEERKTNSQLNKEEAYAHNEEARRLAEAGGPHPGYKTRATEEIEYMTTAGTGGFSRIPPVAPTEGFTTTGTGDYATTTGHGATTATGDPRHPTSPVHSDASGFDSGATYS